MRKLSVKDIARNGENCYSFVIGIAKRARQISEEADKEGIILEEKPVQMAVEDFINDKCEILPPAPEDLSEEDETPHTETTGIVADDKPAL